ncbi:hypothetical protein NBO_243g0002 [Nosema bombycis CQ1]|uniref:Uncharacterized protein n=1 Tax=Nosema bombycis (strain CQ1 / CVCC 102059) TaxID=578461 RepID=R0M4V6_NOSB1|nr:hypothetical protein NBO_243g0002 [Nosema bombycis CQ1]|eukprot:EOB13029.1 hypothetical protein NBO_243g0002 [Nosema bombycis CQ1]
MFLFFLLTVLNIQAPNCVNTTRKKNGLNKKTLYESKALWASVLFDKGASDNPVQFDDYLFIDNRTKPNYTEFTKSESLMFYILNYNLQNREIHDMFNNQFISNVIINIFNPNNNKFAYDYVRYVVKEQRMYPNIPIINNNVINLITNEYSFEWAFSKILCGNLETKELLDSLFCKKDLENISPRKYIDLIFEHTNLWKSKLNLFVVYFEILKCLQKIAKTMSTITSFAE